MVECLRRAFEVEGGGSGPRSLREQVSGRGGDSGRNAGWGNVDVGGGRLEAERGGGGVGTVVGKEHGKRVEVSGRGCSSSCRYSVVGRAVSVDVLFHFNK